MRQGFSNKKHILIAPHWQKSCQCPFKYSHLIKINSEWAEVRQPFICVHLLAMGSLTSECAESDAEILHTGSVLLLLPDRACQNTILGLHSLSNKRCEQEGKTSATVYSIPYIPSVDLLRAFVGGSSAWPHLGTRSSNTPSRGWFSTCGYCSMCLYHEHEPGFYVRGF